MNTDQPRSAEDPSAAQPEGADVLPVPSARLAEPGGYADMPGDVRTEQATRSPLVNSYPADRADADQRAGADIPLPAGNGEPGQRTPAPGDAEASTELEAARGPIEPLEGYEPL